VRSLIILTHYCSVDEIENNEMGRACSACGGGERGIQDFGGITRGKDAIWETQTEIGE